MIRELQSLGMNIQPTHAIIAEDEEELSDVAEEVKKEVEELKEALESEDVETTEVDQVITPEAELITDSVKQTEPTANDIPAEEGGEQ